MRVPPALTHVRIVLRCSDHDKGCIFERSGKAKVPEALPHLTEEGHEEATHHWGYTGSTNPQRWATLNAQ